MAENRPPPVGRPAPDPRIAPFLVTCRRLGIRAHLFGGWAVDAWRGTYRRHKDLDILVPDEDLPALVQFLRQSSARPLHAGMAGLWVAPPGLVDILVARHGPDGLWTPAWRQGKVPWPPGEPFGRQTSFGGVLIPAVSAEAMWLRLRSDREDKGTAQAEASLLATLLSEETLRDLERWRVEHSGGASA